MLNRISVSEQAEQDLQNILLGLIHWKKGGLEESHAYAYVDEIIEVIFSMSDIFHHFPAAYPEHKRFGNFIHRYRRNARTLWYIVYDKDPDGNIFINKIVSNHLTQ